ncbi:MAG: hypothetical protein M1561_04305 [Gammaproteobacteria bacterium]|nr:hypothetical protein [Gammaproteobacteria bacterium]
MQRKLLIIFLLNIIFISACSFDAPKNNLLAASRINSELGILYLKQGKIELAKNKLLHALDEAPHDYASNVAFAYFLEVSGDHKNAEKYYLSAISNANEKGAAWNSYGIFLYRAHRYKEAQHYFYLAATDLTYDQTSNAAHNFHLASSHIQN